MFVSAGRFFFLFSLAVTCVRISYALLCSHKIDSSQIQICQDRSCYIMSKDDKTIGFSSEVLFLERLPAVGMEYRAT